MTNGFLEPFLSDTTDDFRSGFYQLTKALIYVPPSATGGFYTQISTKYFFSIPSKDGNNVYHCVNNGYASSYKPTQALTAYKKATTPSPSSSTTTSDYWRKVLDKIFA